MRFDEAVTPLAIALLIVKLAHLASERPLLAEGLGFPLLNELLVTLPDAMQSGEDASLRERSPKPRRSRSSLHPLKIAFG
jgi:hypothetical protein